MTAEHKRLHAEATFNALQVGCLDANDSENIAKTAEHLKVPAALVWLAVDGVDFELIDALVDWWPRKEGA
jgi:hypothetical protein